MRDGISETLNGFQSTPPERGATGHHRLSEIAKVISIHAPRAGSDSIRSIIRIEKSRFQSTPPERGATITVRD